MDINNLTIRELQAEGRIITKKALYSPKSAWEEWSLEQLESYFENKDLDNFISGTEALYLSATIDYFGASLYWTALDVEDPNNHSAIQANIETAKNLFFIFEQYDLTQDLIVSLTGQGFRFIWPYAVPYRYAEAFQSMLQDRHTFPGIDPAPQTGKNKFLRTIAYRGHRSQTSPPKDVHVEYLDSTPDLLDLDTETYQQMVAGPPDMDRHKEKFPNLLPRQWAPPALMDVLNIYERRRRVKSNLMVPKPFLGGSAPNWDQIWDFLDQQGISRWEHETSNTKIYRLDRCPSCGKREGNPYLTLSGWLRCFRANNCEAGRPREVRGRSVTGLSPGQWISGYVGLEEEEDCTKRYGLDEARYLLKDFLEDEGSRCYNVTPGVGKTHQTLEAYVPQAAHKQILISAQSRELCHEIDFKARKIAAEHGIAVDIMVLEGRNDENCQKMEAVNECANKGFTPAYIVCPHCEHKKGCSYFQQLENIPNPGLVICTHHKAIYIQGEVNPSVWIIDENATDVFYETKEVPQIEMDQLRRKEPESIYPLFDRIREVAMESIPHTQKYNHVRLYATALPPAVADQMYSLQEISPEIADYFEYKLLPMTFSRQFYEKNDFSYEHYVHEQDLHLDAVKWWDYLWGEHSVAYVKVSKPQGKTEISYVYTRYKAPDFNCPIIHLDGTIYGPEIQATFPEGMEIVDIPVSLDHCRKTHIKISRGKGKTKKLSEEKKRKDLELLMKYLRPEDQKVLLLTHKAVEEGVLALAQELRPDLEIGSYHFFGPRGVNAFEDFDACIAYGTPMINPLGKVDTAMAMFEDESEVNDYLNSCGRRDLVQAIHRIRPVNGNKNIVVMGSYWPTKYLGSPDQCVDMMRKGDSFTQARERLTAFAQTYGFINKEVANMLGVGTRGDGPKIQAWQEAYQDKKGGRPEFVLTLTSLLYKNEDEFEDPPPALVLEGNNAWGKLVDAVRRDTDLPRMLYKPLGPGKPSLALGRQANVQAFYSAVGAKYNPGQHKEVA